MHGVILDRDSFDAGDLDLGRLDAVLPNAISYPASRIEQVPERIANAEVVLSNKVMVGRDGIEAAPELRLIVVLINTARGGIVDEQALADALRDGVIGAAGVDVLTTEPPTHGNPLLDPDIPNLIVTPHNAWASRETRQRLADEVAANIDAFQHRKSRNIAT